MEFAKKVMKFFLLSVIYGMLYVGIIVNIDANGDYDDDFWARDNKHVLIISILLWLLSTVGLVFFK